MWLKIFAVNLVVVCSLVALGHCRMLKFRLSAANLPSKDYGGFDDPYVMAYAKTTNSSYTKFGSTEIMYATRSPDWENILQFQHEPGTNQKWKFLVKDWDLGWNEDDTLGRVEVKVDDVAKAMRQRNDKPIKLYLARPRGGVLYLTSVQ